MIMVYVPFPSEQDAERIASTLLSEKLVACVNLVSSKSSYLDDGEIRNADETVAVLKTRADLADKLSHRIVELHPYDTPAIIRVPAQGNPAYMTWLEKELA